MPPSIRSSSDLRGCPNHGRGTRAGQRVGARARYLRMPKAASRQLSVFAAWTCGHQSVVRLHVPYAPTDLQFVRFVHALLQLCLLVGHVQHESLNLPTLRQRLWLQGRGRSGREQHVASGGRGLH
jgi:hypothetical protein